MATNTDDKIIKQKTKEIIKNQGFSHKYVRFLKEFLDDPIFMELIKKDYEKTLEYINIPTLYLVGTKDEILNYKQESDLVNSFNNPKIKVKIYKNLNHYLTKENAPVGTYLFKMDQRPLKETINWTKEK